MDTSHTQRVSNAFPGASTFSFSFRSSVFQTSFGTGAWPQDPLLITIGIPATMKTTSSAASARRWLARPSASR